MHGRSSRRILVLVLLFGCLRTTRGAACATADEPSLAQLSAAALRVAALEPERIRSLIARARRAALLPHLHFRTSRGGYDYVRDADTLDPSVVSSNSWRFEINVSFALDRLIFDPHELRASEAAAHIAERRIALITHVGELWSERRRLASPGSEDAPTSAPPKSDPGAPAGSAEDRCAQLTALLDAMTNGALSTGARSSGARSSGEPSASRPTGKSLPGPWPRP